jgi:hypothetical protein
MLNKKDRTELNNDALYSGRSSYDLVPFFLLLEWRTSFSRFKK